jgi:hypothetical protein
MRPAAMPKQPEGPPRRLVIVARIVLAATCAAAFAYALVNLIGVFVLLRVIA